MTRKPARKRFVIEVKASGPGGRGFEEKEHTALLDGRVIGVWHRDSYDSWAGARRGIPMVPYREWRAEVRRLAEEQA